MKTKRFKPKKWRRKDIILFLERLELYVTAGLTINRALHISAEGIPAWQKRSIQHALNSVEAGGLLSKALSESIGLSKTIAGLIEHGESSGELVGALGVARSLMEREDELLKKCTSAMAYPVIIGIFASLLTIGLVRGVMPQIIPMLRSLHVQLPLITRVVIFMSESFLSYGLYAAVILAILLMCLSTLYKKRKRFRSAVHSVILRTPLVGRLAFSYFLSVFLRSCGALVESGLPVAGAYADTVRTIPFMPLCGQLGSKASSISRGVPIGTVFASSRMPSYVAPLINAGEMSGTLGTSMVRAASILDREIEHTLKRLTSLIEPVMMAGMGMVVGSIALSIMMPIYDISRVLQQH